MYFNLVRLSTESKNSLIFKINNRTRSHLLNGNPSALWSERAKIK